MLVRPPGCDMVRPAREAVPADFTLNNLSKNPVNLSIFIEFYRNSISPNAPGRAAIIPAFSPSPDTAIAGNCGSDESLDQRGKWLSGAPRGGNDSVGTGPRARPREGRPRRTGRAAACPHGSSPTGEGCGKSPLRRRRVGELIRAGERNRTLSRAGPEGTASGDRPFDKLRTGPSIRGFAAAQGEDAPRGARRRYRRPAIPPSGPH